MIRNLNQLAFQGFGTILPERKEESSQERSGQRKLLRLVPRVAPIYLSDSPCWVFPGTGMTVLSVSHDGAAYQNYYLDKPVCIDPGVRFCLCPMGGESSAELVADCLPERSGTYDAATEFQIRPRMKVDALCTLFYQEKEQGFFFPGESHPMLELTYVDQGSVHSVADGLDLLLDKGDLVLYGPNQWHMQYADIGVAPRFVTISFEAEGRIPHNLFNRKLRISQTVLSLLNQMLREQERTDDYSEDMILSLLTQLLICLQREADTEPTKLKASHTIQSENEIIRRAQQFISTHVRQKLSVPLVARHVVVSPSYLTALFHKHLQIAPGEYIRRIKLQESKQMIRDNAMNFTEIAAALQYSTVHHFSRQFKEKFGITPTEYAKSVR